MSTRVPARIKKSFAPVHSSNPAQATFPHKLPIELAMALNPVKTICESYELTREDLADLWDIPQFKALYEWAMDIKVEPNGIFRLQMVMLSDDIAETIYLAMKDTEGGMNQRLRAAELAAKLGGLEPPKAKDTTDAGEKFMININLNPSHNPAGAPGMAGLAGAIEGSTIRVIRGSDQKGPDDGSAA
jgi:hypothetical protein